MKYATLTSADLNVPRKEQAPEKLKVIYLFAAGTLLLAIPSAIVHWVNGYYLPSVISMVYTAFVVGSLFAHFMDIRFRVSYYIYISLLILLLLSSVYEIGLRSVYWLYPMIVGVALTARPKIGMAINVAVCAITAVLVSRQLDTYSMLDMLSSALIVLILAHSMVFILLQLQRELKKKTITDPLTGLYNRRYLSEVTPVCISDGQRYKYQHAALMIDVDFFKVVNDQFGHSCGDKVLVEIAELLKASCRKGDYVFRMGGEEFLVVARVDNPDAARHLGELIRQRVESTDIVNNHIITVSIGVSMLRDDFNQDQWLRHSDSALYRAKEQGRNRTILETTSLASS